MMYISLHISVILSNNTLIIKIILISKKQLMNFLSMYLLLKCIAIFSVLVLSVRSLLVKDSRYLLSKNRAIPVGDWIRTSRSREMQLHDFNSLVSADNPMLLAELAIAPLLIVLYQFKTTADIKEVNEKYQELLSKYVALSQNQTQVDLLYQVEDLQNDFSGSLKAYQQLFENIENKLEILEGKETDRKNFETELRNSFDELSIFMRETDKLRNLTLSLKNEIQSVRQSTSAKISSTQDKLVGLKEEIDQNQRLNTRERASLRRDMQKELRRAIYSVNSSLTSALSEVRDTVEDIHILQQLQPDTAQIDQNKKDLDEVQEKLKALEGSVMSINQSIANVSVIPQLVTQLSDISVTAQGTKDAGRQLQLQIDELNQDISDINESVAEATEQRKRIVDELTSDLFSQLQTQKQELLSLLESKTTETSEISRMEQEELRSQLNNTLSQISDLSWELDAAGERMEDRQRTFRNELMQEVRNHEESILQKITDATLLANAAQSSVAELSENLNKIESNREEELKLRDKEMFESVRNVLNKSERNTSTIIQKVNESLSEALTQEIMDRNLALSNSAASLRNELLSGVNKSLEASERSVNAQLKRIQTDVDRQSLATVGRVSTLLEQTQLKSQNQDNEIKKQVAQINSTIETRVGEVISRRGFGAALRRRLISFRKAARGTVSAIAGSFRSSESATQDSAAPVDLRSDQINSPKEMSFNSTKLQSQSGSSTEPPSQSMLR